MTASIQPFKISIPQIEVDRLLHRLQETRHPVEDVVPDAGKDYGFETTWMLNLLEYWKTSYSWSQAQAEINSLSHFTTNIESVKLHFVHQRSPNLDAIPILLLHGWPGSFHEFHRIIPLLTSPKNPITQQSFHCIVPSLPGFGFSSSPPRKGWTVKDTARILHVLVTQNLNYTSGYIIQAGDWGQFVARELCTAAYYFPDASSSSCRLLHLNYCPGTLPSPPQNPREEFCQTRGQNWRKHHIGYAALMRTRPHSLGFMLNDNPLGLLTFVGEKYDEAANPAIQASPEWKNDILTTVHIYYFTNTIMSSSLVYYENVWHEDFAAWAESRPENYIQCPFAYTSFKYDTAPNSKRAVERTGNLVQYKERDDAGHFACLEGPHGVAEDLRELVRDYWEK